MQDMYTVAINGVALHVDAEDAAFMQRYAAAAAAIPSQPIKDDADGIRHPVIVELAGVAPDELSS